MLLARNYLKIILLTIIIFFSACSSHKYKIATYEESIFPKHYLGLIPGANIQTQYQLDLFKDKTYFLHKKVFKNSHVLVVDDDIGTWSLDERQRLVLSNQTPNPKYFYLKTVNIVELMDRSAERIQSDLSYDLVHSLAAKTLEPEVKLCGMYSYMADTASFKPCYFPKSYPLAFEKDSIALERAYLKHKRENGEALKVKLQVKIKQMKRVDSETLTPTIVVEKFIKINPQEHCQNSQYSKASLTNTHWRLTLLNGELIPNTKVKSRHAYLMLKDGKVQGNTACNGYGANYKLNSNRLSFSTDGFMMTRMFCKGSVEPEFIDTLARVRSYKIEGEYLHLYDINSMLIARFESLY